MVDPSALSFPVSYFQIVQETCAARHMDGERYIAERFQVSPAMQKDPQAHMTGEQFRQLMVWTAEFIAGDANNQHKLIEAFPPTIHGYVGLAAITSDTVKSAMDIALRYAHQVMPAFEMSYAIKGDLCEVSLKRVADFGAQNALLCEMVFCALHSFLHLFGRDASGLCMSVTHRELILTELPVIYPGLQIRTACLENTLVFPAELLSGVVATRNAATRQAIEQLLEQNEARLQQKHSLARQVSSAIFVLIKKQDVVEAKQVAKALTLSMRTLSRRLAEEGTSFRQIYNDCRCAIARDLLTTTQMNISQISEQLGFSDEANFSRFFKQQAGQSPALFRRQSPGSGKPAGSSV